MFYFFKNDGQALAELAVFGALFLLILGALLTYGLKYNFQQQARMTAFRRALAITASQDPTGAAGESRGSGSYTIIHQKPMPDAMDMFGVGSPTPISASGSVYRSAEYIPAVDAGALPISVMDIQTTSSASAGDQWMRRTFLNAALRVETGLQCDDDEEAHEDPEKYVKQDLIDRYRLVYGSVTDLEKGTGSNDASVRIIDSCSGNMLDYSSCYQQSRMMIDNGYCAQRCEETKAEGDETDCGAACNSDMSEHLPWYAADGSCGGGTCTFPVLERMFRELNPTMPETASMGIQPGTTQVTTRETALKKIETPEGIMTQGSAQWSDTMNQTMFYRNDVDMLTGESGTSAVLTPEAINTTVSGEWAQEWTTEK